MNKRSIAVAALLLGVGLLWAQSAGLPAGGEEARDRLNESPRHGEWITYSAEGGDRVEAWVVYPERNDPAPVVVVIHENRGLNDWARAVADQFAAEGFIAIAPDFLSGKAPGGAGTRAVDPDGARDLIRTLEQEEIYRRLRGAVQYATSLPAATKRYAVVGYCWGGANSFGYATQDPNLAAAVVFYGTSPATESLRNVRAPVLGLYGGADNRVNATIPAAEAEMKRLGKRYEVEIYDGAGHAFLRGQDGQNGANMAATEKSWPRAINFLKQALENRVMLNVEQKRDTVLAVFTTADDGSFACDYETVPEAADIAAN
ncbi:MAG: dienelactone hydrolase family protein [Spirochaetaceae bacterium]|nr:MAG: dienelactone hydrolase family protein [Spirochaetaceae bacterium]